MKWFYAVFFSLFFSIMQAQMQPPAKYFSDPLDIPLVLAGTFGELRSNHFHSGLDIKTQHREGLEVKAAAAGSISRIKIQHYGYGKALYVQHPNGYTTVYGHLQRLAPKIESYLKKQQYANETYEIELYPEVGELKVDQGEVIAYSGNTGGSGGPHLHFEIRDGKQRPMNPELFGMEFRDTRAPIIHGVYAYPLDENSHVNNSSERQQLRLIPQRDGSYTTEEIDACGKIGFGVSTVDQKDGAPNHNGVYKIQAKMNGDNVFELNFDRFSFSETRHLNQLIDYEYYTNNNRRIQKLFIDNNNPLSMYGTVVSEGKLEIKDSLNYNYTIKVSDFAGNESLIRIPIQGDYSDQIRQAENKETEYFAEANKAFSAEANGIDVYIPKGSLYEDTYLDISFKGDTIHLHKEDTPLHRNMTIGFDVSHLSPEEKEKFFIARLGKWGKPSYSTTHKKANRFTTGTRTFGDYTLVADIEPPSIKPLNFYDGQWISNNNTLKVKIADDLSGIKSYRATVNGKFILMEYEYKDATLTHNFDDDVVTETENNLKIVVTDNVGNSTTYEGKFFRKE
ncbi:M23 family metallopeptidase [Salegentibacter chungangensis]|uniref:M23 family metallopeptidase n=1 Tax=Salegentibacter chungangensis TaxID=1335724 RepID=A0ABW3NUZ3_9FLAO